jgi:hypothetical protein
LPSIRQNMGQRRFVRVSRAEAGSLPRKEYGRNLAITSVTSKPAAADHADRPVEVNTIVMPTHQWTLAYTWQAE